MTFREHLLFVLYKINKIIVPDKQKTITNIGIIILKSL